MKKERFERLRESLEQAIADEHGDSGVARVTVRQQSVKKLRINIMLDEEIVDHFKRLAARPNSAAYQTQINQALRETIGKVSSESTDSRMEMMADQIADKVAKRLRKAAKRKAA